MKVWLVMHWEYSDSSPEAVFSTEEKATAYAIEQNMKPGSGDAAVIEFEVDKEPFGYELPAGKLPFAVRRFSDGAWQAEPIFKIPSTAVTAVTGFAAEHWATDEQHALKIGTERWSKWAASGGLTAPGGTRTQYGVMRWESGF